MPDDLEPTADLDAQNASDSAFGFKRGERVGRYRLISVVGEGGMGVVWRAEQTEPVRREVALKLIKPGMDSKRVLARFEAERQALAVMDHPCIARVLDGGATDKGLPYFAMELVKGEPISSFCDTHKLSINGRLDLFISVCEAVQHAHMKGVIHRDLKPGNVLVAYDADGRATPKVIDFGVAKALNQRLTESTLFTEQGQFIGTPEYMSPEQAEMSALDIDTRTDVYSLGVMLYELLTGALPFDTKTLRAAGFAEIQRIIREVDPPKPSTRLGGADADEGTKITAARSIDLRELSTTLRRDLDWIVMRCLEKERSRRYDTASDVADELRRYLNHEPVEAGPPNAAYRARKFVRRNRAGVIAGSMVAGALVMAVIGTTWGMLWALSERERAELAETDAQARASELEIVAAFQSSQLSEIDAEAMGSRLREAIVEAAPEGEREELRASLGEVNFTDIALGSLETTIFDRAVTTIDEEFVDQPLVRARLLQTIADTLRDLGMLHRVERPQTEALAIRRRELGDDHPDTLLSVTNLGVLFHRLGRRDEAERQFRDAVTVSRRAHGDEHQSTVSAINNLAVLLKSQGRLDQAEPLYRESVDILRRLRGDEHANTLIAINNLGALLRAQGRFDEAEPLLREALATRRRVLGDEHTNTLNSILNMGFLLESQGRLEEAEPFYREALAGNRRVLGDEHTVTLISINNMGSLLLAQGRPDEAEPLLREALATRRRVLGEDHPHTLISLAMLATLLVECAEFADAEPVALECERRHRERYGPGHTGTTDSIELLIRLYDAWHEAEAGAGHDAQAVEWRFRLASDDDSGG